jgi:small subunit ribosomal protein S18
MQKSKNSYECTLLIRPNASETQAKDIARSLYKLIESEGGSVTHSEYWGFKTLNYAINKNTKAHYILIGFQSHAIEKIKDSIKYDQNILRSLFVKRSHPLDSKSPLFVSFIDQSEVEEPEPELTTSQKASPEIDYKNIRFIKRSITEHGKIVPAYASRMKRAQQKEMARAIKRARFLSLLPYIVR